MKQKYLNMKCNGAVIGDLPSRSNATSAAAAKYEPGLHSWQGERCARDRHIHQATRRHRRMAWRDDLSLCHIRPHGAHVLRRDLGMAAVQKAARERAGSRRRFRLQGRYAARRARKRGVIEEIFYLEACSNRLGMYKLFALQ